MRTACWIPKATNTLSQYVIFIAFPLEQWLHERVSGQAHIETQADARQGWAGKGDAARETLRDTVWAHIEK